MGHPHCGIVPYVESAFPETFLVECYLRAKADKTLDSVFGRGGTISLNRFIVRMQQCPVAVAVTVPDLRPLGIGWLYEVTGTGDSVSANVGFVCFRDHWGKRALREVASLALRFWCDTQKVHYFYGSTRLDNRSALRFAQEIGFEQVGRLPGFFGRVDGALLALDACNIKSEGNDERSEHPDGSKGIEPRQHGE